LVKAVVEMLENDNVKIEIEVDASEFEKSVEKVYLKNRGAIAMPGFRKGKAPRKIIERFYGEGVFHEDAFELIFPKVYYKTISENGLKPAGEPTDIDLVQIGNGQNLIFTVKVQVEPKPELGVYKGVEIVKMPVEATEEDMAHALSHLVEEHARLIAKEDGAATDDRVNISYTGYVDDEPLDLFSAKNRNIILGTDTYMQGFDAQLIGMRAGEQKQFDHIVPEDYSIKEFAGKTVTFDIAMNEVKYRELPELDDEFAKDVSEFETLEELKESIKIRIEKEKSTNAENEMHSQLLRKISEASKVEVPDSMIKSRVSSMLHETEHRIKSLFGKTLEELDEIKYISIDEMKDKYKTEAYNDIKAELVMDEIARIEGLVATEDEIEAKLPKDFPVAWKSRELDNNRDINYFENVKEMITKKKVIDFLVENAIFVDKNTDENDVRIDEPIADSCCAAETEG